MYVDKAIKTLLICLTLYIIWNFSQQIYSNSDYYIYVTVLFFMIFISILTIFHFAFKKLNIDFITNLFNLNKHCRICKFLVRFTAAILSVWGVLTFSDSILQKIPDIVFSKIGINPNIKLSVNKDNMEVVLIENKREKDKMKIIVPAIGGVVKDIYKESK